MLKPRHPAALAIERGFSRTACGDVHYRAAGQGPVVVALHESPNSSLSMLPVIEALADRYRVICPDTPGYGLSDPLAQDAPRLEDFAEALRLFLDSAGAGRIALYGAHTGAALAINFANRHPERVTALVIDGVSAFTAAEVDDFRSRYLAPYEPRWDGGHVMGVWSRVKDAVAWFPWHLRDPQHRLSTEPESPQALHRRALGFLQAGPHYAKAYIQAAAFDADTALAALRVPTTVMARPNDVIADHLQRLTPSKAYRIVPLGDAPEDWRTALHQALEKGPPPDPPSTPKASPEGSRFLPLGDGRLHAVVAGPESGKTRLLLPDLPGDIRDLVETASQAHPGDRLIALSLPGCGWSDPLAQPAADLGAVLAAMDAALEALGVQVQAVTAVGASGLIAQRWADRQAPPVPVELIDPPGWLLDPALAPDDCPLQPLPPRWDGTQLTGAWFQLRDMGLYDTPPGMGRPVRRAGAPHQDVERLDRLFRAYVQGPECADLLALAIAALRSRTP